MKAIQKKARFERIIRLIFIRKFLSEEYYYERLFLWVYIPLVLTFALLQFGSW